ncbi:hypothetical protein [Allokutzneria albata]|uniref:Uncharacterized protein n=1 Tax=Allokutzneria albata TaxID=211114 RepID=A0A1H0AJT6_ALLAB|nr:hypothetical protein [Allokutzneria albata]SDN33717.1 hypothetical protein SAMN04489726_6122 [Allokutzneria albata]
MRARRLSIALPATALLAALCAAPALAAPPTTPVPTPVDPDQPPFTNPNPTPQPGPIIGDAGAGLGLVRVLPGSVQTSAPGLTDEQEKKLPKQAAGEFGVGLAIAQGNSHAVYAHDRAIAESSPFGFALGGRAPRTPGALAQTASPDNAKPTVGGLTPPANPVLNIGLVEGSVHARWDDRLGPCVEPIADAKTSVASLSAINTIPSLPRVSDLSSIAAGKADLIDAAKQLSAPLSQLGGLLSANGSLVRLPETMSAHSTVRLVDVPGQTGKAVNAVSTVQLASIQLLAGTPQEIRVDVVSKPTLTALSTGDAKSSKVSYTAPVLRVSQGGKTLGTLDAANPKLDIPVGIPLPGLGDLPKLPIVGGLLGDGGALPANLRKLDIGVLRLQVGQLKEKREGSSVGAVARLMDLQLLPTDALPLPGLPAALAQVAFGEQVARASAPPGGVVCKAITPTSTHGALPPEPQGSPPGPALAYTNAAYQTVPLFWTGTFLLLVGVIMVAALPDRRRV